jgi:hypothetical protein
VCTKVDGVGGVVVVVVTALGACAGGAASVDVGDGAAVPGVAVDPPTPLERGGLVASSGVVEVELVLDVGGAGAAGASGVAGGDV